MNSDNNYSTSDLSLAAAISLWFPVEEINRNDPNKAIFFFRRNKGLDECVEAFWRRELKVDPLTYFNQLKFIKSRIHER